MRSGSPVLFLSALTLVACAPTVENPFQGPAGRNPGDPTARHAVRFQASCDYCSISWNVQEQSGSESARGLWSKNVYVYVEPGGTVASLHATPSPGSAPVRWVRIRVDGEVVAQEEDDRSVGDVDRTLNSTLSVTAPIEGRKPRDPRHQEGEGGL